MKNKLKAVYILWISINLVFLLTSSNFLDEGKLFTYNDYIYITDGLKHYYYDLSEFVIFTVLPLSIFFSIKLWSKK